MDGIFIRKKFSLQLFLLFFCGLLFIGMYIFLNVVDPVATNGILSFLVFGILILLSAIASWLFNFGAYFRIDEDSIKAKYHYFGKIDCKMSDVAFAQALLNTLNIQLKNGKIYTVKGIENPLELSLAIRANMTFEASKHPEVLIEKLNALSSAKKKKLIYVCVGLALMFINIFITVFLTGEREMYEFTKRDWTVFAAMGVIEVITVITTFFFAAKAGKNNVLSEKLKYDIKRSVVETTPLPYGFVTAVYTDYDYNGRIILYGYPHQDTVYYTVQAVDKSYELVNEYTSDTYETRKDVPFDFELFADITEKVLDYK